MQGVPGLLRRKVWYGLLGRPDAAYATYLAEAAALPSPVLHDIEKGSALLTADLRRTFPGAKCSDSDSWLAQLRRILTAFAARNRHLRYCQGSTSLSAGMNFVAGFLLLALAEGLPKGYKQLLQHYR